MALQTIRFTSKVFIPVVPCQEVVLCLDDVWAARTVSGFPWVYGVVQNNGRYLGSGGMPFPPSFENPRAQDLYEYSFTVDDVQFIVDIVTGLPFVLPCEDILEVNPYACTMHKIQAELEALAP